jgi:putative protein-disulfide isomerase
VVIEAMRMGKGTTTLHYIFDPLCGWCYGASPLVSAAREFLPIRLHAGGMMTGAQRQPVTPQLRDFVLAHDQRIAQLSGQPFGEGYRNGLLRDGGAVFDSEPPITAILAADAVAGRGLDLLQRAQRAHYVEGRRISEDTVLAELAADIGLDAASFAAAVQRLRGQATAAHIAASRTLLAEVRGNGFPTFVIEREGRRQRLDISPFIGNIQGWRNWLGSHVAPQASRAGEPIACAQEGCALPGSETSR